MTMSAAAVQLDEGCESGVDLAFGAGLEDMKHVQHRSALFAEFEATRPRWSDGDEISEELLPHAYRVLPPQPLPS